MARDSSGTKNQPQYSGFGAPADSADMSEIANYAALVGNRKADVSTVRTGLTGADVWNGLEFFETDTGLLYVYSGGWKFITQLATTWTALTLTSGWLTPGGWGALQYRVNQLGNTEIRGQVRPRSGYTTSEVFATLPVGSRPQTQVEFVVVGNTAATRVAGGVLIAATGAMTVTQTALGDFNLGMIQLSPL